jgi:hypothetical protein
MPFEIPEDLHPDILGLAWLLGQWHGNGRGEYPTIEPFSFEQDVAFAHDGRPFLHYFSQTWITDGTGQRIRPGALETGFLRPGGPIDKAKGPIELLLTHPTGFVEIYFGELDGPRLTLQTDAVVRTPTAKEYTAGQRMYGLVDGDLMYAYDMAAQGQPMQSHLWGQLKRV